MGNLIADQVEPYTDTGMIVRCHYVKNRDGVKLAEITFVPTWVHRFNKSGVLEFRVLPVAYALYAFENGEDPLISVYDYHRLQNVWYETLRHVWLTPYSIKGNI